MREFTDGEGVVWKAGLISHGRTSAYLNKKVHRPLVQFSCVSKRTPSRYASLPAQAESLELLAEADLLKLLGQAKTH